MDGVLVNSGNAVERVWHRWAIAHNLDPGYVIQHAHGRRSAETLRVVAPELEADRENLKVEQMEIEDKEGIVAVPGAIALLARLPEDRYTIVTSATPALAVARLEHVGVPIPKQFITADDVVNGKPLPEPYLKGAALLGVAPTDCLVFEDTPAGIRSAQAAGMRVIALQTTYPAEELATADAVVRSFDQVEVQVQADHIEVLVG